MKFTVVIATCGRPKMLLESLQSVVGQTLPPHEVIVVVDGSQDDSAAQVRQAYPQVIIIEQPNRGEAVARNTAIARATGDWIAFADDDDLWHLDKLRIVAEFIARTPDCQALNHPLWYFAETEDGPRERLGLARDFVASSLDQCMAFATQRGLEALEQARHLQVHGNSFRLYMRKDRGLTSGAIVSRMTLLRAGLFPPMQSENPDWTMFVNVARLCEWHTLPQRLGFNRFHGSQNIAGSVTQSLFSLAGTVNAWYTGRPLPWAASRAEVLAELKKFGPVYRTAVQNFHWAALRARQFRTARMIRAVGKLLLPRRRDLWYALIPPPITWRWERYVLGMHRGSPPAPASTPPVRDATNSREASAALAPEVGKAAP